MCFLFFAPHLGQIFAFFAISAPQTLQFVSFAAIFQSPLQVIYQIGILRIYQKGIIPSRVIVLRMKELRKARNITQLKMAMDLNMSQNTISRYENGEREPGLEELVQIADYLDVSIDYLLERTKNPKMNI